MKRIKCTICENKTKGKIHAYGDDLFCDECWKYVSYDCSICGEEMHLNQLHLNNNKNVCNVCWDSFSKDGNIEMFKSLDYRKCYP